MFHTNIHFTHPFFKEKRMIGVTTPGAAPEPAAPATPPPPAAPPPVETPKELSRELKDLWARRLELHTGAITKDTRAILTKVLGQETTKKLPRTIEPHHIDELTNKLVIENRVGFYPYIREKNSKKQMDVTLRYQPPGGTPGNVALKDLVSDPHMKEAHALAWLYKQSVTPANVNDLSGVFHPVNAQHMEDADVLLKMQKMYQILIEDIDYYDLGDEGTEIMPRPLVPPFVVGGIGRLGRAHEELCRAEFKAEEQAGKKKGNPLPFEESAKKKREEITSLKKKKITLQKELSKFNTLAQSLGSPPAPWTTPDVQAMSEIFDASTIGSQNDYDSSLMIGTTGREIREWLEDEGLKGTRDTLLKRFQLVGSSRPPAGVALDALMLKVFGSRMYGKSEKEQEKFYEEMRDRLVSDSTPAGSAGTAEGETADTAKPSLLWNVATAPVWVPWMITKGTVKLPWRMLKAGGRGVRGGWRFFFGRPATAAAGPKANILKRTWDFWFERPGGGGGGHGGGH